MLPRDSSVVGTWGDLKDGEMVEGSPGIRFSAEGRVNGYDGYDCNGFGGTWEQDADGVIRTSNLHSTLAYCDSMSKGEPWFDDWDSMVVSNRGHQLIVLDEDGKELGRMWRDRG